MKKLALMAAFAMTAGILHAAQPYAAWTKYRELTINTTASGANVTSPVADFPLLVRLSNAHDSTGANVLSQALANGADVRFTDSTGNTALAYEIESWSATSAAIWVRVPSIPGNATTTIRMYWGRNGAPTASNPTGVFGDNDFLGVWHLGNASGAAARPNAASPGTNDAVPAGTEAATMMPRAGLIGMADSMRSQNSDKDGADHMNLGQITFPDSMMTTSMWISLPDPQAFVAWTHFFTHGNSNLEDNIWMGRENGTNNLRARGAHGGAESDNAGSTTIPNGIADLETWIHIGVSKDSTAGKRWRVYKDGVKEIDYFGAADNHIFVPGTRLENYIARSLWSDRNTHVKVDEMRTSSVARSPDWMKLEYETQKPAAAVVKLAAEQAQAAVPLAYISKSSTYLVNQAVTPNEPVTNGAASGWAVTPALPAGLTFNTSTGVISGTPTAAVAAAQYRVTATVGGTPATDTLTIAVSAGTPPGAPLSVSGLRGNGQVTVSWTAPASSGTFPITEYTARATQDPSKNCTWTTGPLSCAITGLTNGTSYTFEVRASSDAGDGPFSAPSGAVIPATVPGAPTNVTAVAASPTSIKVSWTAPASDGGLPLNGFIVTSDPDNRICSELGSATTCTVSGLSQTKTYTFTVTASNATGSSAPSAPSDTARPTSILPGSFSIHMTGSARPFSFALSPQAIASTEAFTLTISDLHGRTVWSKTVNPKNDGVRKLEWNGRTATGRAASAGVYLVKVTTASGGSTNNWVGLDHSTK